MLPGGGPFGEGMPSSRSMFGHGGSVDCRLFFSFGRSSWVYAGLGKDVIAGILFPYSQFKGEVE